MRKEYKILALVALLLLFGKVFSRMDISLHELFASVLSPKNIVTLTNESRKSYDLSPLQVSEKLTLAAQKKAEDMFQNQYFSHFGLDQKSPWEWIKETGYSYLYAGENLAIHFVTSEEVLDGWMTSREHRENILNQRYTEIGIAVKRGKFWGYDSALVVQMFGRPLILSKSTVQKKLDPQLKLSIKKPSYLVRSQQKPTVKGIAIQNAQLLSYIHELERNRLAIFFPKAKMTHLYELKNKNQFPFSEKFYIGFVVAAFSFLGIRFFRKKYYTDKKLACYTVALIIISFISVIVR